MSTTNLFVYGTLQPGGIYFARIEPFVRGRRRGRIEGVLVNTGWYPALIPGEGIVLGTLLEVEPEALAVTDEIEGYTPGAGACLFLRKQVQVRLEEAAPRDVAGTLCVPSQPQVIAWTYEYAYPDRLAHLPRLIVGHEGNKPVHAFTC